MKSFMIMGLCHMRPKRLVLTKSAKTKYLQKRYFSIINEVHKNMIVLPTRRADQSIGLAYGRHFHGGSHHHHGNPLQSDRGEQIP